MHAIPDLFSSMNGLVDGVHLGIISILLKHV